jgi:hypothetical protein
VLKVGAFELYVLVYVSLPSKTHKLRRHNFLARGFVTLEFSWRGSFTPIKDIVGGGPFHFKPRQWTDDTPMALIRLLVEPSVRILLFGFMAGR